MPRLKTSAFILLATAALAAAPAEGGAMATLAVLPLRGAFSLPKPPSNPYPGQGRPAQAQQVPAGPGRLLALEDQINQRVTMAFFRTGRFQMIERSQLNAVLKEGKFEQSGLVDDATAARLGKQIGATFVLVGSYTGGIGHTVEIKTGFFGGKSREDTYPGHLEVRVRMVNTEDGSIREPILLHAASLDAKSYHSYELLLDDLSRNLDQEVTARFPLTGYVIKVISEREVLVDLGQKQRLEKGASFQLVEQGADVVHPVTGKLVQGERRVLTQLQVTDVGDESSILKVTGPRATLKVGQSVVQGH
jgi:curli biogenesis system outer membrane secretion channel CsgG